MKEVNLWEVHYRRWSFDKDTKSFILAAATWLSATDRARRWLNKSVSRDADIVSVCEKADKVIVEKN